MNQTWSIKQLQSMNQKIDDNKYINITQKFNEINKSI